MQDVHTLQSQQRADSYILSAASVELCICFPACVVPYIFFVTHGSRFGRSHKRLLEAGKDEDVGSGMLSLSLRVMQQVHQTQFQASMTLCTCLVASCQHGSLLALHTRQCILYMSTMHAVYVHVSMCVCESVSVCLYVYVHCTYSNVYIMDTCTHVCVHHHRMCFDTPTACQVIT